MAHYRSGQFKDATTDFHHVVALRPTDAKAYYFRAYALSAAGKHERAIADYGHAMELDPKFVDAIAGKAWLLATAPKAKLRNGTRAIELARRAVALDRNYTSLSTLAAAYAESGDFAKAFQTEEFALDLLRLGLGSGSYGASWARQELYKAGRPFRLE